MESEKSDPAIPSDVDTQKEETMVLVASSSTSFKIPSHAQQRRWMKHHLSTPQRASSKEIALQSQRMLASVRDRFRQHASGNEFAYTETIHRLINSLLFEILLMGDVPSHLEQPVFADLSRRCMCAQFINSVEYRKSTWKFVEDNIDDLLTAVENKIISIAAIDSEQSCDEVPPPLSAGLSAETEKFSVVFSIELCDDTYSSCMFKMRQIKKVLEERAARRARMNDIEKVLYSTMYQQFRTNWSLRHVGCVDDTVKPCEHSIPPDDDRRCQICTLHYEESRPATVLRCCEFKKALCIFCLLKMAFVGSEMGCKSFFTCAYCRAEIPLYEHLDEATPELIAPQSPTVVTKTQQQPEPLLSISDGVKQNKRKRSPVARFTVEPNSSDGGKRRKK